MCCRISFIPWSMMCVRLSIFMLIVSILALPALASKDSLHAVTTVASVSGRLASIVRENNLHKVLLIGCDLPYEDLTSLSNISSSSTIVACASPLCSASDAQKRAVAQGFQLRCVLKGSEILMGLYEAVVIQSHHQMGAPSWAWIEILKQAPVSWPRVPFEH